MPSTAFTLAETQLARNAALTAPATGAPTPRAAALEALRRRNAALDAIFYDVSVVKEEEARAIAPWLAAEGAILIVPPSGQGPLTLCASVEDFFARGGENVRALAIAGVGSSALGSAAFARNVADAWGAPVAAIVSGYGLADLLTEALGGYYLFGALNGIRHVFEGLDRFAEIAVSRARDEIETAGDGILSRSLDVETAVALLTDPRFGFDLLTGHSKGNLVLSEALYEIGDRDHAALKRIAARAHVVTISAIIAVPPAFHGVIDAIGEWDWFGRLNSRPDIKPEIVVPRAWHHTNTELPAHLPVTKTLRKALASA